MRALLAIAAREVADRAPLLWAAAVVSLAPFVMPMVGIPRDTAALATGPSFVLAAALLCGSSVIARDLADGRLGFFFARAIPWWSIWGGKLLAAVVLTLGALVLVAAPLGLATGGDVPSAAFWLGILIPVVIGAVGLGHAAAVSYRARDRWVIVDLAALALAARIVFVTSRSLERWGAAMDVAKASLALWVLAAMLTVAGAVQVARGRTDVRRGHVVLSVVLWAQAALAVGAFAGYAAWVRTPRPGDIRRVSLAAPAPRGTWMVVAGQTRPSRPAAPALLVDLGSARYLRLGTEDRVRPAFSADGLHAAWIEHATRRGAPESLFAADLSGVRPAPREVPLPVPPSPIRSFGLSPDGSRMVTVQDEQVAVFDLGSAQTRVVLPLAGRTVHQAVFATGGLVRLVRTPLDLFAAGDLDLVALDSSTGQVEVTGTFPTPGHPFETWSPDGRRVIVVHRPRPDFHSEVDLYDAARGALLARPVTRARGVSVGFLADGRIALVETGAPTRLRILDGDGTDEHSVEVAPRSVFTTVAEAGPGMVAVTVFGSPDYRTMFVDAATGHVIRIEEGVRVTPVGFGVRGFARAAWGTEPLAVDDTGALVRIDVATGARQVVLGGP